MEQWHVKTEIKESNIVGAGNGRFFCDNYKKGTIVRKQKLTNIHHILKFKNENCVKDFKNINTLVHFGHSAPSNTMSHRSNGVIFVNVPFMNTNHSKDPNIKYKFTKHNKYTVLTRDVKKGDEMLQDYTKFSKVQWFEEHLKQQQLLSCRQLGYKLT
tara:strand:- start:2995 stop:3465 length:471 start_codon:yes stop_codon:yes gene_type:complete